MQYLERVRATLGGRDDFAGLGHGDCQLGVWLDGLDRPEQVGEDAGAYLSDLRDLHERFHAESDLALRLIRNPDLAEPHVTELFRLSGLLVSLLFRLDRMPAEVTERLLPAGRPQRRRAAPRARGALFATRAPASAHPGALSFQPAAPFPEPGTSPPAEPGTPPPGEPGTSPPGEPASPSHRAAEPPPAEPGTPPFPEPGTSPPAEPASPSHRAAEPPPGPADAPAPLLASAPPPGPSGEVRPAVRPGGTTRRRVASR
jgi:hypothetical protein